MNRQPQLAKRSLIAVALLGLLTACSSGGGSQTLTGHMTVTAIDGSQVHFLTDGASLRGAPADYAKAGTPCTSRFGFADVNEDATVVVKNEHGTVIATGALQSGALARDAQIPHLEMPSCAFAFSIPNVPKAAFYTVTVANRGELNYSYDTLNARGWDVELTLGGAG